MKFILTFLLIFCFNAWAGEVSLLDHAPVKNESAVPVPAKTADTDFEHMKEFMQVENERLKIIKLLHLDLEQADLELKKQEIETKMAALSSNAVASVATKGTLPGSNDNTIDVVGIFIMGSIHEAMIKTSGAITRVKEGQSIRDGIKVKKINAHAVTVEYAGGKLETFNFRN